MEPSWICCQLGARERYAVARSLHRRSALELLLTDTWVRPGNPIGSITSGLRMRFHDELISANVDAANVGAIAFELQAALALPRDWRRIMARNEWFQKMAVRRLARLSGCGTVRTIMAFSYAARGIFTLARRRGWRTVLGQIDPGPFEDRLVARLYEENAAYLDSLERPPPEYWSNWREECALADRIVVNSEWSQQALLNEGVPAAKIRVIPLGFEPSDSLRFHREYPKAFSVLRPLRVLFLGQINLRKGIAPLFEAIRLLRGRPVEFLFVGPVQISIPHDLRNHPQVHWIGAVRQVRAAHFYRNADVFMFPTLSDGFGLTQLEAQAWKLPVITTKCCGEVVEDGRNGCLLSEVSADSIARVIQRCLTDPALLREFSRNSSCDKKFSLESIGTQWLNVFESER